MSFLKSILIRIFIIISTSQLHFISEVYSDTQCVITAISPVNGSVSPDTRPAADPFFSHNGDYSIPAPTRFCWSTSQTNHPITYSLYISEDSVISDTDIVFLNISDTQYNVWNLKMNTTYFWMISVLGLDSTGICKNSPLFSFSTPDLWPRMIFIEGTTNVRDIGGLTNIDGKRVAQGLFYRSGSFDTGTNVTANRLDQFRRLGIVCEIDLRGNYNDVQIGQWLNKYIHPLTDSGEGMYSYYYGLVNTSSAYRIVFEEMALKQNYPMILHCIMGADRTGTVVALLEALLGYSELQMGQDYIWTSLSTNGIRDTASISWTDVITFLKSFDKGDSSSVHLGCWNYLQSIGVSVNELISIRKIFLNDDHQPFPTLSVISHTAQKSLSSSKTHYCITLPGLSISAPGQPNTSKIYDLTGKRVFISGESKDNANRRYRNTGIHIIQVKE